MTIITKIMCDLCQTEVPRNGVYHIIVGNREIDICHNCVGTTATVLEFVGYRIKKYDDGNYVLRKE